MVDVTAARVAQLYAQTLNGGGAATGPAPAVAPTTDKPDFSDVMQNAVGGAVETLAAGEAASAAAVTGEASLVDVVTAISAAEVTLQTVVTVRDKMVNAYQEILRMPI